MAASGFRGETIVAQLQDASGRTILERSLAAKKDDETLAFRFQWKPDQPGLSFYRLRARTGAPEVMAVGVPLQHVPVVRGIDGDLDNRGAIRGQGDYLILHSSAGWDGDPRLWSVQDAAITGRTTAELRRFRAAVALKNK